MHFSCSKTTNVEKMFVTVIFTLENSSLVNQKTNFFGFISLRLVVKKMVQIWGCRGQKTVLFWSKISANGACQRPKRVKHFLKYEIKKKGPGLLKYTAPLLKTNLRLVDPWSKNTRNGIPLFCILCSVFYVCHSPFCTTIDLVRA